MAVFVLGKGKLPLMPCSEKRARKLLEADRAVVVRLYPFTIRLKDRTTGDTQPLNIKLDPGSKVTGIALTRDIETVTSEGEILKTVNVLNLFELTHRGSQIKEALVFRKSMRKNRRNRNLRYREERYSNRCKATGWLAPSLKHRANSVVNWVGRFKGLAPITHVTQELVKFDTQKMVNPEISGIEYQQGTLQGYEVREYLLEKFNRTCVYCDKKDVPLQIEHIHPKSKGGSSRISNLVLACSCCNIKKGTQDIKDFLAKDPARLSKVIKQTLSSLKDAAAVTTTRWALFKSLKELKVIVSVGRGSLTKFNRQLLGIPKTHALDAACVGNLSAINNWAIPTLQIKCMGRGFYKRTLLSSNGFPRAYLPKIKAVKGFVTGDIIKAVVTKGKKIGTYIGRVAVRSSGFFNIQTSTIPVQGIASRFCRVLQRNDGYAYL